MFIWKKLPNVAAEIQITRPLNYYPIFNLWKNLVSRQARRVFLEIAIMSN